MMKYIFFIILLFTTSCSTADSVAKSDPEFILHFKVKCSLDDASMKIVKSDPRIHTLDLATIIRLSFDRASKDTIANNKHRAVPNLSTHSEKINLDIIDTANYISKHEPSKINGTNVAREKWNLF